MLREVNPMGKYLEWSCISPSVDAVPYLDIKDVKGD